MSTLASVILRGTIGTRPTAGIAGRLYISTDEGNKLYRDNGTTWDDCGVTVSGGGALVLLEQHAASSSAELDFTACITSTYDEYEIHLLNLVISTTANLGIQCSTNGGSSYDTGGSSYQWSLNYSTTAGNGGGASASDVRMNFRDTTTTLASNGSFNGKLAMYNPGGSLYKAFTGQIAIGYSGGSILAVHWVGAYLSTTAVNAFRVIPSTGNITSGTVRVYGVAKT